MTDPYGLHLEEADLKRERRKARELRQSPWWKRKCARGICYYCGNRVPAKELTMDHIVPIARGGRTTKGNLATACKDCNNKKKQLLPMEWEAYLELLGHPGE
jgi:5-methylcytosine-specific restriction endonuclease McrA